MQEARSASGRGPGLLRRLSARQWRLLALVVGVLVVVAVVVIVLVGRNGGAKTESDVQSAVAGAVTDARLEAERERNGQIDVFELNRQLEGERGNWVIDLAASPDGRAVGVAARQPDGPTCILVWSAVGGARSATVADPVLPCVGRVALAAAD